MKKIIHIDMDCFFAAVEVKHDLRLLKKPVAVGGGRDQRGVIAAASYEARKFGVRSAMSTVHALRLCPDLILIHPKFSLYKEESVEIHKILKNFTDKIELLSLDEAYLDVTKSREFKGSATLLAKKIRQTILLKRGLTASAGIANNKFLAKISSDLRKPNGQFTVSPHKNSSFTKFLPVGKLWGVGKKTEECMHKLGFKTCGDLRRLSLLEIQRLFGSMGGHLYKLCQGIDDREVKTNSVRKSFSVERTFPQDLITKNEIQEGFKQVYIEFVARFKTSKVKGYKIKGVCFKLKSFDFQSRSKDVGIFKDIPDYDTALSYMISFWEGLPEKTRLIGFGIKFDTNKINQLEFNL